MATVGRPIQTMLGRRSGAIPGMGPSPGGGPAPGIRPQLGAVMPGGKPSPGTTPPIATPPANDLGMKPGLSPVRGVPMTDDVYMQNPPGRGAGMQGDFNGLASALMNAQPDPNMTGGLTPAQAGVGRGGGFSSLQRDPNQGISNPSRLLGAIGGLGMPQPDPFVKPSPVYDSKPADFGFQTPVTDPMEPTQKPGYGSKPMPMLPPETPPYEADDLAPQPRRRRRMWNGGNFGFRPRG